MKTLRVHILAFCLMSLALPAQATATKALQQTQGFAVCAGRLSALMEHQWMFDGTASEDTELRRAAFVELIDAVLPGLATHGVDPRQVLHWRIEAKMAQAQLLQRATFGEPGRETRQAKLVSHRLLRQCGALLLG